MRQRKTFFIQVAPREAWHVESEDNCEIMLCGKFVSVETTVRVRSAAPNRSFGCPDCFILYRGATT